ncbi:MAG: MMPL family transporter, partial [Thermoleophilia bacterium]|nr:MMPL family transporter [Thermoleophilia bacterium]
YSAYEANSRIFDTFGTARNYPVQLVFQVEQGDIREQQVGIERAIDAAVALTPGASTSSFFSTGSDAYVSADGHTMFAELYPAGMPEGFVAVLPFDEVREALAANVPEGVTTHLTGVDPIFDSQGEASGPSVLVETLLGGVGALVILLFVFGTLPAVLIPMLVAISSILTTFLCVLALTYLTDVSLVVQFLVALVGLGIAIDYSLLMIFRFREELRLGRDVDSAIVETMQHAGRSVIVSGSTVAIGLLSMLVLPLPFIRSIGLGGMLIPAVSVLAAITLLPAMLRVLGPRINRIRVMPKKVITPDDAEQGFWDRWAAVVARRPLLVFLVGMALVVVLLIPASRLNPADAQTADQPAAGDAEAGRQALTDAGLTAGVYRPFLVLVEGSSGTATLNSVVADLRRTSGVEAAQAPPGDGWRRGDTAVVEAFSTTDGASKQTRGVIDDLQKRVLPAAAAAAGPGVRITLGGPAAEERDFVHAVYGNFPYVLAFVVLLTFILLARAFRSIVLPLKAVILNLISLGCAFGVVVFIFQEGHGSEAIWGVQATGVVISWIPLMIFAFLFGISMDYEVFMITRIRESYDETGDTKAAISLGLGRTGKLVTSAALVLMFAFFALSTGPGLDIKQFGIGLAAGIIIDATLIRLLLVPSSMQLLGRWNWWLPAWCARLLRTRPSPLEPKPRVADIQVDET